MHQHSPVVRGKTAAWYAKNYKRIEADLMRVYDKLDTPFLDKRIKPGMHVLDAMMGQGRHALRYARRGAFVHGNDLNRHMVAIARKDAKRLKIAARQLKLTTLDATSLHGLPDNVFDLTFAMYSAVGTIPGKDKRQAALDAFARVTKPGGEVIVHAHNRWDCFFELDMLLWAIKTTCCPDKGMQSGDIVIDYRGLKGMFNHLYTPGELRESFSKAGLEVIEEQYLDYGKKRILTGPLRMLAADGFIMVGKKSQSTGNARRNL